MSDLPDGISLEDIIARRLAIRDELKALKRTYEAECAALKKEAELFDAWFLGYVTQTGQKNVSTRVGLAYRYAWTRLKTTDKQAWRGFAVEHLDMADIRPVKEAVNLYIEEYQSLPPGLKYDSGFKMGFRRDGEKEEVEEE